VHWELSNEGGLDLLCLNGVKKKIIKKDEKEPETFEHPMSIDIFVIPYTQILNLSVTYYIIKKIEEVQEKRPNIFTKIWAQAQLLAKKITSKETLTLVEE